MSEVMKYIKRPLKIVRPLGARGFLNWLPDKLYLKLIYRAKFGQKLNLNNPRNFNEKLQWLKLFYRHPQYSLYVDKYAVRSYVSKIIGEEYLIPLIGIYNNVDDINWDKLPNKFVLKCTHGSGTNIICTNKKELNIKVTKKKLKKWMNTNWYWYGREWPYKNITPRIICEEYMDQGEDEELRDYRFFCFNGVPKFIAVDLSITNKSKTRRNLYDLEWNLLDSEISYPKELNMNIKKPTRLAEMIELSEKLSTGFPHVRIDFFQINNQIFFGEMTFYHQSGMGEFKPKEFGEKVGSYIRLPNKLVK